MPSVRLYLAEESRFQPTNDESMRVFDHSESQTPDWSSDPMEILMRKQELERLMLEAELSLQH